MKTKIHISILLVFCNLACSSEFYTVTARDGLYVREQPSPNGKHVLDSKKKYKVLLQKGEKVRLLFVDKAIHSAHGIDDSFAFVEYRGNKRGYVFKGYLESSSGNLLRIVLSILLILGLVISGSWLFYKYRFPILATSRRFAAKIRNSYAEMRERQKSAAELQKIEQSLKAEREKEIAIATAAEREKQAAAKAVSRQVRGIKWLLFLIVLALLAVNNPSKSDFTMMIREKVSATVQQESDDLVKLAFAAGKMFGVDIQSVGEDAITQRIISNTRQIDCFIFTLYFVPTPNRAVLMIGVLRKFIPITSL